MENPMKRLPDTSICTTDPRAHRVLALATAALLMGAAISPGTFAQTPSDKARAIPPQATQQPAATYEKTVVSPPTATTPIGTRPHTPIVEQRNVDPHEVPPQIGPGPVEHPAGASGTHGIIFVGGHSRLVRDKSALNPQPIPPGHATTMAHRRRKSTPHWDLSKNKGS
jgi:hypothetical protein